jgi:dTDP-4-amino-4,6-dideoxygalactose transaminase
MLGFIMVDTYRVLKDFEDSIAEYCGSKFAVGIDNASNGLFLCLKFIGVEGQTITIPNRTYLSVPCSIIHAGAHVKFDDQHPTVNGNKLRGQYKLDPFPVWDSALTFRRNMYISGQFMCLSFSGPHKFLKLGKGGMILTDNAEACEWFKKARYSGRNEGGDHLTDTLDVVGWNYYLLPDIAARGLAMMPGVEDYNEDLEIEYQDLSKQNIYTQR